jgi:type I restriction enzyme R subunit
MVGTGCLQSVRAKLRLMVKRILRKYKYPPDLQDAAVELVLQQAQALGENWATEPALAGGIAL